MGRGKGNRKGTKRGGRQQAGGRSTFLDLPSPPRHISDPHSTDSEGSGPCYGFRTPPQPPSKPLDLGDISWGSDLDTSAESGQTTPPQTPLTDPYNNPTFTNIVNSFLRKAKNNPHVVSSAASSEDDPDSPQTQGSSPPLPPERGEQVGGNDLQPSGTPLSTNGDATSSRLLSASFFQTSGNLFSQTQDRLEAESPTDSTQSNKKKTAFVIAGHANLHKSQECTALLAHHIHKQMINFKLNDEGYIIKSRKVKKNPKRKGKPSTLSEWSASRKNHISSPPTQREQPRPNGILGGNFRLQDEVVGESTVNEDSDRGTAGAKAAVPGSTQVTRTITSGSQTSKQQKHN